MKSHPASALFIAALIISSAYTPSIATTYDRHDRHPAVISQPAPLYPFELRKAETEGAVLVSFNITAQGNVTDVTVIGSTNRVFETPTLHAAKKWKYSPAIIGGQATAVPAMQLVTFRAPDRITETPTFTLVSKMKTRLPKPTLTWNDFASTSLCFCGSGKEFNGCHFHSLQASR